MKKILVRADNLDGHICRESGKIYDDGTIILTPGARDELARRGVSVERGPRPGSCAPQACGCDCGPEPADGGPEADAERLMLGLAAALKNECGVNDPAALKALSLRAMAVIKANL